MAEPFSRHKANALARIMEDRQVTLDEALEIYRNKFKLLGSKGGKSPNAARPFRDTPGLAKAARAKRKKYGKNL